MDFKYKIADVAKEFDVPAKKVIETVSPITGETYKTGGTFGEKELDFLLEKLTRENAEESLDAYLASGAKAEPKPQPKAEKKPEAKKPEAKKQENKRENRKPEKPAEKRNEKRVTLQELARGYQTPPTPWRPFQRQGLWPSFPWPCSGSRCSRCSCPQTRKRDCPPESIRGPGTNTSPVPRNFPY